MAQVFSLNQEQDFCEFLSKLIQSANLNFLFGSGASMPAINVAGNIESEINDLLNRGETHAANVKAYSFIEELEEVDPYVSIGIADDVVSNTLESYVNFLQILDHILFERKNIILPRQANIFTTNYDMFFESASSEAPSILLNDGFDRTKPTSGQFKFASEKFFDRIFRSGTSFPTNIEVPSINLIKLHGSLSWQKQKNEIVFSNKLTGGIPNGEEAAPELIEASLRERVLILPNLRKFQETLMDRVYYDLLRIFSNSFERENALLLSFGFSFCDEHILDITKRALRNPTSALMIFSYDTDSADNFNKIFSAQRNVFVVRPEDNAVIDFAKYNNILTKVGPNHA